jgi:hypothetical protein
MSIRAITFLFLLTCPGWARYDYEQNHYVAIQIHPHHLHKRESTFASLNRRFNSSQIDPIGEFDDYFLVTIPKSSFQNTEEAIEKLLKDSNEELRWVSIQKPKRRLFKRTNIDVVKKTLAIADPGFDEQCHLVILQ